MKLLPAVCDWSAVRRLAAGEALGRILTACGYETVCRQKGEGEKEALFLTTESGVQRLPIGPVKLLWRGKPLNGEAPDWPWGVSEDAAQFFLTARPLSAPAELDLDLAVRRDFGNHYYAAVYVQKRLHTFLSRGDEGDCGSSGPFDLCENGRALALAVGRFPAVVRLAAERCDPYPVNRYAVELAAELWRFIHAVPLTKENRRLGRAAETALTNALVLLGECVPFS